MMENFRIPPSPAWYTHAVCTPNKGLLYIAGNQSAIAYIPPISQLPSESSHNRIIHLNHHLKSIVCDPNWSMTKWFVTMNDQNTISVWNLETESICRGHKAHHQQQHHRNGDDTAGPSMSGNNNSNGGAMCITKDRQILSIDRHAFVKYCMVSNTYALLNENFIQKPNTVCALKSSPYDIDILAVGYRNGLILIVNLKQTTVLQKLRAHDTEIISLEWMRITADDAQPIEIPAEPRAIKQAESRKPTMSRRDAPQPIVDEGDMFEIHSFDYLEEEFGTISKPVRSRDFDESTNDESNSVGTGKGIVNNENFNYVEACESLRDQIVGERDEAEKESLPDDACSAVNMSDIKRVVIDGDRADGSIVLSDSGGTEEVDGEDDDAAKASNRSTIGSSHDVNELVDIEIELSELKINVERSGKIYLASGAQESFVIIWDVNDGSISDKLQLKVQHGKMAIPKPICAIAWYQPSELLVNSPNGKISKWSILSDVECKIHKSIELKEEFIDKSIIGICSNAHYEIDEKYVWTFSMHLQIIGRKFVGESSEIIAHISTLPIGMLSIRECPHNPNRIAIAGNNKRISILDLTTFKANNIQMQSLTSKIQGKVLALAWHPQNESQIAFSTNEGRVGVFDIGKTSSPPEIMRNFNGKNVYSLSYGRVDDKSILFACNDRKLMMFPGQSAKNTADHSFKIFPQGTSAVSAIDEFVAVGLADGTLKILDHQLNEVLKKQLAKKYISSLAWSPVRPFQLAVASMDDKIHIINVGVDEIAELNGHQSGVACVKWSNQSSTKLVSAGFDGSVRVWDTEKKECIAWHRYGYRMFCALFMPTDENYVICSGHSETIHIFDIRQHLVENVGELKAKNNKKKSTQADISWATLHQTDVPKMKVQEKKKLKKLEKQLAQSATAAPAEVLEIITNALESVSLEPSYKLNFTTLFHLTNKELNKDPLHCLERILTGNAGVQDDGENDDENGILHSKLFSTRENVQKLLEIELQNHKTSKTESIGNLLIPQINYNLKENILDSITAKRLTQQQIALAPSISYEFWRNCCIAYASQCFEEGLILQGLPYLLAIHQTTEIIDRLCEAHFYREAWVVAKMYEDTERKTVFDSIATQWIKYLEQLGSLDSAAMIAYMADQPVISLEILNKRKNHTPQIESIVKLLQEHVAGNKVN